MKAMRVDLHNQQNLSLHWNIYWFLSSAKTGFGIKKFCISITSTTNQYLVVSTN